MSGHQASVDEQLAALRSAFVALRRRLDELADIVIAARFVIEHQIASGRELDTPHKRLAKALGVAVPRRNV